MNEESTAPNLDNTTQANALLLRASAAAAICSVSERTWRTWDVAGKIPRAVYIGRAARWRADELRAWVAAGCPNRITWQAMQPS